MQSIKIRLEPDEFAPVMRLAAQLKVTSEDIAYVALDSIMSRIGEEAMLQQIQSAAACRRQSLPKWADRPREIHAYESMT